MTTYGPQSVPEDERIFNRPSSKRPIREFFDRGEAMKIQHSPGPWHTRDLSINGLEVWAGTRPVARTLYHAGSEDRELVNVNAGLIALAPTAPHDCDVPGCPGADNKRKLAAFDGLLEAAKRAVDIIWPSDGKLHREIKGQLQAAIAAYEKEVQGWERDSGLPLMRR